MAAKVLTAEVDVTDDDSYELTVIGEIYRADIGAKGGPLVTHVIINPMRSSKFQLDPGNYQLRFHVERAGGKFNITVKSDDKLTDESTEFDTELGFEHRVFTFVVV
jgi:hypothetical protein